MSDPGLFIVGTDTGVGKTVVACGLLRLAARGGAHALPYKPVETGVHEEPSDAAHLLAASSVPAWPLSRICPFPYPQPVAPALAATLSGARLTLDSLVKARPAATTGSFLVTEAAGGLMTPYTSIHTGADLAAAMGHPVVLVGRNALGTINQTVLALEEIRRRRLLFAGLLLVITRIEPTPDQPWNAALIESLTGVRTLASLPYLFPPTADQAADALAPSVDPQEMAATARPLPVRAHQPRLQPASGK